MTFCLGPESRRVFTEVIELFMADRKSKLRLNKIDGEPDMETQYIASILEWSKYNPKSRAGLVSILIKNLPECRGRALASMIYAADQSGLLTPEQVESAADRAIRSVPGEADAVALGFYHVGWRHGSWWSYKKALQAFLFADKHCHNAELKRLIEDRLEVCRKEIKPPKKP